MRKIPIQNSASNEEKKDETETKLKLTEEVKEETVEKITPTTQEEN